MLNSSVDHARSDSEMKMCLQTPRQTVTKHSETLKTKPNINAVLIYHPYSFGAWVLMQYQNTVINIIY